MPKETSPVADRKFRLSNLELLLLAAIVIGLAFMVRVVAAPGTASDSRLSATVSQLEQRIMEMSDRLNLVGPVSGTPVGSSEARDIAELYGELAERLDRLEQKVEKLERRLAEEGRGTSNGGVAIIQDSPRKRAISEETQADRQR